MKLRFTSESGMTLIEVITALLFLVIIAIGFTTLFTFTGRTVNYAGRDASANADARSAANALLTAPVDKSTGEQVGISIVWNKKSQSYVSTLR